MVARRPAEPVHQDPGDGGRPAGDHGDARRGHLGERDADLQPGPVPGRSWTPSRPASSRPRPTARTLARCSRWRRSSCPGSTPRSTSGSTRSARRRRRRCTARRAIANARLAYEAYEEAFGTDRWKALAAAGANPQRPLWASTSTKNPEYRDVIYVEELIAPGTVNTMPEPVIHAFADHGEVADTVRPNYDLARPRDGPTGRRRHRPGRRVRHAGARGRREVRGELARVAGRRPEDAGRARRPARRAQQGSRNRGRACGEVDGSASMWSGAAGLSVFGARQVPGAAQAIERAGRRRRAGEARRPRTPRCGARPPRPSRRSGSAGSTPTAAAANCSPSSPTCARRWPRAGLDHVVLAGHGRLVAGARGHHATRSTYR